MLYETETHTVIFRFALDAVHGSPRYIFYVNRAAPKCCIIAVWPTSECIYCRSAPFPRFLTDHKYTSFSPSASSAIQIWFTDIALTHTAWAGHEWIKGVLYCGFGGKVLICKRCCSISLFLTELDLILSCPMSKFPNHLNVIYQYIIIRISITPLNASSQSNIPDRTIRSPPLLSAPLEVIVNTK